MKSQSEIDRTPNVPRRPKLFVPSLEPFYVWAQPVAYLLLRVAFGLILMTHGVPKLLGVSHGSMADPLAGSIHFISEVLHLPWPGSIAYFVALLEGVGGLMLALGFLTRVIAPMVTIQMAVICYLLGPKFAWLDKGMEYALLMAFLAFFLSICGSGRWSLDWAIGREI